MKISRFLVFNIMNTILQEDVNTFADNFPLKDELRNSTFLITGATGLLGSTMVHCLLALDCDIKIIAPVRDILKAKKLLPDSNHIILKEYDIVNSGSTEFNDVDFVIHGAAPTASKFFIEHPVETSNAIYLGGNNLLNFCKSLNIRSAVFLSSLEVYGNLISDTLIPEDKQGELDTLSVRSSYPLAKQVVENLCIGYCCEYNVPIKIVRLTQVIGAGIAKTDNRVFAQYVKLASYGEDIILHTTGESARPYLYTIDAISAILFVLLKGENGAAYNAANEHTYISARKLADIVKSTLECKIDIKVELNDTLGYAPASKLPLSSRKLNDLGWKASYSLEDMIQRTSNYIKLGYNE